MLDNEQVQKVRLVLAASGWNDVMEPVLRGRGTNAVRALCLARSERTTQFKGTDFDTDDDVLRAIIKDCEWMISCWRNEITASEHNRLRDELDAALRGNGNELPAG